MADTTPINLADKYIFETDPIFNRDFRKYHDQYVCPCCNFPTLHGRMGYEICGLCDWEDDGQDDHNADKVLGGPNRDYSLREARNNFRIYSTMYRPTDINQFNRFDKSKLTEIIQIYNESLGSSDPQVIKSLFKKARKLEDSFRK
jgi:hypothetical protein